MFKLIKLTNIIKRFDHRKPLIILDSNDNQQSTYQIKKNQSIYLINCKTLNLNIINNISNYLDIYIKQLENIFSNINIVIQSNLNLTINIYNEIYDLDLQLYLSNNIELNCFNYCINKIKLHSIINKITTKRNYFNFISQDAKMYLSETETLNSKISYIKIINILKQNAYLNLNLNPLIQENNNFIEQHIISIPLGECFLDLFPNIMLKNKNDYCTHSNRIGNIDQLQLFYLQNKGLDYKSSVKMLLSNICENNNVFFILDDFI